MVLPRPSANRIPRLLAIAAYGVLCGLAVGFLILVVVQAGSFAGWAARTDFGLAYVGAHIVIDGRGAQLYDIDLQRTVHAALVARYAPVVATLFNYPAWDALLFVPLGWLSYPGAFLVWTLLSLAAGGTALGRLAGLTGRQPRARLPLLLALVGSLPIFLTIALGQYTMIPLLALTGALLASRAGHERAAGAWLLLGLIKPQLIALPVLALLMGRRWRALAVFAAGTTAVLGVSMLLLGNWLPAYIRLLIDFTRPGAGIGDFPAKMQNWRGLVYGLLGTDTGPVAGALVATLTLLSLAIVAALCWRAPRNVAPTAGSGSREGPRLGTAQKGPGWDVRFAVAVMLGLLVDPHVYMYDTAIAVLPALVFWDAARGASAPAGVGSAGLRVLRALLAGGPFVALLAWLWPVPGVPILPAYFVLLLLSVGWAWPYLGRAPLGAQDAVASTESPAAVRAAGEGWG